MKTKTFRVEVRMVGDFYVEATSRKEAKHEAEQRWVLGYQPEAELIKLTVKEVQ
jgi:hypothetical protein